MNLSELLASRKSSISQKWLHHLLETYPSDSRRFLKEQKDHFANPVGSTLAAEINRIVDLCIQGAELTAFNQPIDNIIKVRAVQDFSPSGAVGFILDLKRLVREEIGSAILQNNLLEEFFLLEVRLDAIALMAFELYVKYREKLFELQAREIKNQVSGYLRKTGIFCEIPEWRS